MSITAARAPAVGLVLAVVTAIAPTAGGGGGGDPPRVVLELALSVDGDVPSLVFVLRNQGASAIADCAAVRGCVVDTDVKLVADWPDGRRSVHSMVCGFAGGPPCGRIDAGRTISWRHGLKASIASLGLGDAGQYRLYWKYKESYSNDLVLLLEKPGPRAGRPTTPSETPRGALRDAFRRFAPEHVEAQDEAAVETRESFARLNLALGTMHYGSTRFLKTELPAGWNPVWDPMLLSRIDAAPMQLERDRATIDLRPEGPVVRLIRVPGGWRLDAGTLLLDGKTDPALLHRVRVMEAVAQRLIRREFASLKDFEATLHAELGGPLWRTQRSPPTTQPVDPIPRDEQR
jgi:hypothetical protein